MPDVPRTASAATESAGRSGLEPVSPFANTSLPAVLRTTAGVEPYAGPWGEPQVRHLLRRTMFGASRADVSALAAMSMHQAVDLLLSPPAPETSLPLNTNSQDVVPVGQTWINAIYRDTTSTFNPTSARMTSLKSWWLGLMVNQPVSLREKMVLFWHNHFVTEIADVNDPRYSYRYLDLIRRNALGNFKDLVKQMTHEGAMLIYLNGNSNTRTSPNENYARELQELFSIGKGAEVAPGDYTNYTEADVKAAARVLTGWRTNPNTDGTIGQTTWRFDPTRHDTTDKQFSGRYQERVITGRTGADGALELDDLIDMIFAQPETARFLARKLYRWFVYYVIDAAAEAGVITPLADVLRSNNYDVRPALSLLLKSAHFYDPVNQGCVIKSPLDLVVGMCRQFGVAFPAGDVVKEYTMYNYLVTQANNVQQRLGDPPDVAGWPAYYQEPQFYEMWINSDTLPRRTRTTDTLVKTGYTTGGTTLIVDCVGFVKSLPVAEDPNLLIDELCHHMYPIPMTAAQKTFLKNTLLPGLPDYEWTVEWAEHVADPTNAQKLTAVKSKLQALLAVMMQMPEYQLH